MSDLSDDIDHRDERITAALEQRDRDRARAIFAAGIRRLEFAIARQRNKGTR